MKIRFIDDVGTEFFMIKPTNPPTFFKAEKIKDKYKVYLNDDITIMVDAIKIKVSGADKLSKEAKRKYLKSPNHCPYCNSGLINSDKNIPFGGVQEYYNMMMCDECNKEWADVYTITAIKSI